MEHAGDEGDLPAGGVDHFGGCAGACLEKLKVE